MLDSNSLHLIRLTKILVSRFKKLTNVTGLSGDCVPHLSLHVKMISLKPSLEKSLTTGRFTGGQGMLDCVTSSPSLLLYNTMFLHPTISR